jgi:hypothetical protein
MQYHYTIDLGLTTAVSFPGCIEIFGVLGLPVHFYFSKYKAGAGW